MSITDTTPRFVKVKHLNGRWRADLVADHHLIAQFRQEAGLKHADFPDPADAYDRILAVAGKHGFGIETTEPQA